MLEVPAFLLPPPSAIAVSFIANAPLLLFHGWITTAEFCSDLRSASWSGFPLALAIFLCRRFLARSCRSWSRRSHAESSGGAAVPGLVRFGLLPKVLIAFLIAFFPVVISTASDLLR